MLAVDGAAFSTVVFVVPVSMMLVRGTDLDDEANCESMIGVDDILRRHRKFLRDVRWCLAGGRLDEEGTSIGITDGSGFGVGTSAEVVLVGLMVSGIVCLKL